MKKKNQPLPHHCKVVPWCKSVRAIERAHARERVRTVERTKRPGPKPGGFDRFPTRAIQNKFRRLVLKEKLWLKILKNLIHKCGSRNRRIPRESWPYFNHPNFFSIIINY